jgi:hypothetical protein
MSVADKPNNATSEPEINAELISKNRSPIIEIRSSRLPTTEVSLTAKTVEVKVLDRGSELIV